MTKIPDYDTELAAVMACVTALAEHGIPVDIQELLVNGSLQAGIRPHAIFNGVRAAYNTYQGHNESIGGAGYGGMADYEIARSIVRMEVEGVVGWAGITPEEIEASLDHPDPEPAPTVPTSPNASASGPIQSWTGSASQSPHVQQAGSGSVRGALSTPSKTNEP